MKGRLRATGKRREAKGKEKIYKGRGEGTGGEGKRGEEKCGDSKMNTREKDVKARHKKKTGNKTLTLNNTKLT